MDRRLELHELLKSTAGITNVYFQPPPSVSMVYDCIRYAIDYAETKFADNVPYKYDKRYLVTVIVRDPDSAIPDKIAALPMCVFDRYYAADQLHHHVFKLFF